MLLWSALLLVAYFTLYTFSGARLTFSGNVSGLARSALQPGRCSRSLLPVCSLCVALRLRGCAAVASRRPWPCRALGTRSVHGLSFSSWFSRSGVLHSRVSASEHGLSLRLLFAELHLSVHEAMRAPCTAFLGMAALLQVELIGNPLCELAELSVLCCVCCDVYCGVLWCAVLCCVVVCCAVLCCVGAVSAWPRNA